MFLGDNDQAAIKNKFQQYYKKGQLGEITFANCPKPVKAENRFIFTVASALCISMNYDVSTFQRASGDVSKNYC